MQECAGGQKASVARAAASAKGWHCRECSAALRKQERNSSGRKRRATSATRARSSAGGSPVDADSFPGAAEASNLPPALLRLVFEQHLRHRYSAPVRVVNVAGKGRCVTAACGIRAGQYVCEFRGDLINSDEARRREALYSADSRGYMLYFHDKVSAAPG